MRRRSKNIGGDHVTRVGAAIILLVALTACSSSDDASPVPFSGSDTVAGSSTTSHTMGMSTGPDPEPAEVDASPYVFGILPNGTLPLDRGVAREVAVIAQGEPVLGTGAVPVVVRNMTRDTVYGVQGHVDFLDVDNQVVDSGPFAFLAPLVVDPGEIALGAMQVNPDWDLASGTLRAKVDSFNVMAPGPGAPSMAVVTRAVVGDGAVSGTAINDTDTTSAGGVSVTVMCFDTIRRPFHVATVEVDGELPGGESVDFTVPLEGEATKCSQILLVATGIN